MVSVTNQMIVDVMTFLNGRENDAEMVCEYCQLSRIIILLNIILNIDVALGKWCKSIDDKNVITTQLNSVILKQVYCSNNDEVGAEFHSTEANPVSEMIRSDFGKASSSSKKEVLYKFWKQHPVLRKYCCHSNTNFYIEYLNELLKFNDGTFHTYVNALSKNVAGNLRSEFVTLCSLLSDSFCRIKEALELIDKATNTPNPSKWDAKHRKAFQVNFILLKRKYPAHFANIDITPANENSIMRDTMDLILGSYKRNNYEELEKLTKYLPTDREYKKGQLCNNDNMCIFLKVVQQVQNFIEEVKAYKNPPQLGGRIRRAVSTRANFVRLFEQLQLQRIIDIVSNQQEMSIQIANHLSRQINNRISDLGNYFQEVEEFNSQIIDADISDDQLDRYRQELDKLLPFVKVRVFFIVSSCFVAAGLNVKDKALHLALDLLEGGNPLKTALGIGTVQDILESAANLANALGDWGRAVRVIAQFLNLIAKSRQLIDGFQKNSNFLNKVKIITNRAKKAISDAEFEEAKDDFLRSYGDYSSAITLPDIAELGAFWEGIIDEACDVILSTDSISSSVVRAITAGDCWEVKVQLAKLTELYTEIYDFQFELMDLLAARMRSQNSIKAAQELKKEFQPLSDLKSDSDSTITTLAMVGGLSYVAYRANILQAVSLYCNLLEYKDNLVASNGICNGPDTKISSLLNFDVRGCQSDIREVLHDIPAQPATNSDKAYIDIAKLYAGEPVYFKIPNSKWLVDRNWILNSEKTDALYVKEFVVFLPTQSSRNRRVKVTATPLINEKQPGGTVYDIEPQNSLVHEYNEGPTADRNCHGIDIHHPYTTCLDSGYNSVCHKSDNGERKAYPSLYARWKILVEGYEDVTPPVPANDDLTLKIGMRLCKLPLTNYALLASSEYNVERQSNECCSNGQYRSGTYASNGVCTNCPSNSYAELAGYYCQKN